MTNIINKLNIAKILAFAVIAAGFFVAITPVFSANVLFNTTSADCDTVRVRNVTQGTPSVGAGPNGCDSLADWSNNSVSAQPGDIISVAIYYRNTGSVTATGTKIRVSTNQNMSAGYSHVISANVSGGNGGYVSDSVTVNLAEAQTLEYITNSEDSDSTIWTDQSNVAHSISSSVDQNLFNNTGVLANGDGIVSPFWSDQGTLRLRFRVGEEPSFPDSPDVTTGNATSVDEDDVTLHGTIDNHNQPSLVWFEVEDENGNIFDITSQESVNAGNAIQSFSQEVDGTFDENEEYEYRACGMYYAIPNTYTDCGSWETFEINGNNNDQEPVANTDGADDIQDDSAELNGSVDMNDFEDGIVFFAYGQNENDVSDVENDFDTYSEADDEEDGDDFQVVLVDNNHDGDDDFAEDVSGLEDDEEYFYQICVQFENENNNDEIECGGVENFFTDDSNNSNDDLEVNTLTAQDVDTNSALLRGDIDDISDEDVYRYFEWGTNTNMNETLHISGSTGSTGEFSRTLHGLNPDTVYYYRACAEEVDGGDYDCGLRRDFRTGDNGNNNDSEMYAVTTDASSVGRTSAVLNGLAVSDNIDIDEMWFEWGSTVSLTNETSRTTVNASGTRTLSRSISGLSANTTYYYRVVAEDENGNREYGLRKFFRTDSNTIIVIDDPKGGDDDVEIVTGAGSLFLALDIEPDFENVTVGDTIDYTVEYRNISDVELEDVVIQVIFAEETRFVKSTAGFYSQADHNLTVVVGDLEEDEEGSFVVRVDVLRGAAGDLIVAQANAGHDHPSINDAQVGTVPAYAINNVVNDPNRLGAFAFGAGFFPTTFLGWLILLLVIIALVLLARKLYTDYDERRQGRLNIN